MDKDESGKSVDQKMYRGMIRSLLCLIASKLDILFSVGIYTRYQSDSKESHLLAVKRILRYLKGYSFLGLWYFKNSSLELHMPMQM